MPSQELEEFAQLMVEHVRDWSIQDCDRELQAQAKDAVAKRWRELKAQGKVLIPDGVDSVLSHLFYAIDQKLLRLSFTASSGKTVDLPEDGLGELSGCYLGDSDGCRESFSNERYVDDFAGLKSWFSEKLRERDEKNKDEGSTPG